MSGASATLTHGREPHERVGMSTSACLQCQPMRVFLGLVGKRPIIDNDTLLHLDEHHFKRVERY